MVKDDVVSGGLRAPLIDWLTSDKHQHLLPTPWLSDSEFEDFTEALLKAQVLLGQNVRHVAQVERWGVSGDKQEGIDFFGHFNDMTPAAWQCKQLERLRRSDIRDAAAALSFDGAHEVYLVYGRIATQQARDEMRTLTNWTLLDRRDLTEMFKRIPPYAQRDIAEHFWGADVRRQFVEAADDGFVSLAAFVSGRQNPASVMNDVGPLAGRRSELEALANAMNRDSGSYRQIVAIIGPNGRGKTRLATAALAARQAEAPGIPVACLRPHRIVTPEILGELRDQQSIVFVDDAHRAPASLAPLLDLVRKTANVQVVLAARPSAARAIHEQIVLAEFGPEERATIDVNELGIPDARNLVKGIIDGLGLSFDMRNYLAAQATHSPHVAVIAANLIRRGQLVAWPTIDANLREQVLARYQELLMPGSAEGVPAAASKRVLATYALLEPVDPSDDGLKVRIANLCNLKLHQLAGLEQELVDQGVLTKSTAGLGVVPDLLADRICEMTAAEAGYDTGFVRDLWAEFGRDYHHRLAPTLGDLDWRLNRAGGPSVMAPVWEAIRSRLESPHPSRLVEELAQLDPLAASQPKQVAQLLDSLRERLNAEEDAGVPLPATPEDESYRNAFGLRPQDRGDVRNQLPPLYTRAAANDPDLLEPALDALWDLRQRDQRPTHSNPNHAGRMVSDHLANLGRLPDPSFPTRIVSRVSMWTRTTDEIDSASDPLFVLEPLLVKEGLETVQSSYRSFAFKPHLISATAMRPVRDQIRALLVELATSSNLTLAGAAVALLGKALQAPHGYFGHRIGKKAVLQWKDDDLATLKALHTVADTAKSPAIRRRVRDAVWWSAEYAESLHVQQAAIRLVVSLDHRRLLEDELVDMAIHGDWDRSIIRFERVPSLKDLAAQRRAEKRRVKGLTEQEVNDDRMARIRNEIAEREVQVIARNKQVALALAQLTDTQAAHRVVDGACREAQQVKPDAHVGLWSLWNQISHHSPELLGGFVDLIGNADPGPLDNDLDLIIDRWMYQDTSRALAWLINAMSSARTEVRRAIASGFARFAWMQRSSEFLDLWSLGAADRDQSVAQAFLASSGALFERDIVDAVATLIHAGISPVAATRALDSACKYDGRSFGIDLDRESASAVLRLIARAGLDSHAVQEILTGIAATHPELALDHLAEVAEEASGWRRVPDDIYELRTGFEAQPDAFVQWFIRRLGIQNRLQASIFSAALNGQLTEPFVDSIVSVVPRLRGTEVMALIELLGAITFWAIEYPRLAEVLLVRAKQTRVAGDALRRIRENGMRTSGYSWVNGVSEELNSAAVKAAEAVALTTSSALRAGYEEAHARIRTAINDVAAEHALDEQADW